MAEYYIYVCYPIRRRDDINNEYQVSFDEMESFASIKGAVLFCKENYAQYLIAVEKCDHEVYQDVKEGR